MAEQKKEEKKQKSSTSSRKNRYAAYQSLDNAGSNKRRRARREIKWLQKKVKKFEAYLKRALSTSNLDERSRRRLESRWNIIGLEGELLRQQGLAGNI